MISFIRVDDRIIHGQIVTRWSKEYPCDGIIAVNDKAATTPVLTQSFKASTDKKVFVWTKEHWREKAETVGVDYQDFMDAQRLIGKRY